MSGAAAARVSALGVATQLRAWRCIVSTELTVSWCTGGVMSTELAPAHHCTMHHAVYTDIGPDNCDITVRQYDCVTI